MQVEETFGQHPHQSEEAGHQAAHVAGWNQELASALREGLDKTVADAFAFVHTGYATVAALHDVLAGEDRLVFRHIPGDPHPVSCIRVLLGIEMCRQCYGAGPWDELVEA
jgi:hypothetical protein